MDKDFFLTNIPNSAPASGKKELHYFCPKIEKIVQFSQVTPKTEPFLENQIVTWKDRTISTPVPRLTARLAGRSKASSTKSAPVFQIDPPPHFAYFIKKEKLNRF
jgi:hypothetical protein